MTDNDPTATWPPQRPPVRSLFLPWLAWIVWLPFLVPEIVQLLQSPPSKPVLVALLIGVAVFVALYAGASFRAVRRLSVADGPSYWKGSLEKWLVLSLLCALGVALAAFRSLSGLSFFGTFIYTAAYSGGVFQVRRAIAVNAVVLAIGLATGLLVGTGLSELVFEVFLVGVVTFMTVVYIRSVIANRELLAAQHEISRLAVANERLRIARDLHDLLGHKLSLIGLKSDLAGRVMEGDPERAREEIAAIGREARSTLQEVREAVSRYHTSTIDGELRAAKEILSASAIECRTEYDRGAAKGLPPQREEALAWAIREGVTNIVRHSSARSCTIAISRDAERVRVEIRDDGLGAGEAVAEGSGLRGLRERLAAVGGRCEARSLTGGGFELAAIVVAEAAGGGDLEDTPEAAPATGAVPGASLKATVPPARSRR